MKVGITQGINTWKSQPHICPVMLRTLLRTLQLNTAITTAARVFASMPAVLIVTTRLSFCRTTSPGFSCMFLPLQRGWGSPHMSNMVFFSDSSEKVEDNLTWCRPVHRRRATEPMYRLEAMLMREREREQVQGCAGGAD